MQREQFSHLDPQEENRLMMQEVERRERARDWPRWRRSALRRGMHLLSPEERGAWPQASEAHAGVQASGERAGVQASEGRAGEVHHPAHGEQTSTMIGQAGPHCNTHCPSPGRGHARSRHGSRRAHAQR